MRRVMEDIIVYSSGIVCMSVCADNDLSVEEIEEQINISHPTGIGSRWTLSEDSFKGGESNPCDCDQHPTTRKHYLFNC